MNCDELDADEVLGALRARAERAEAEVTRLRACLQRVADCSQDPISKADAFTELLVGRRRTTTEKGGGA